MRRKPVLVMGSIVLIGSLVLYILSSFSLRTEAQVDQWIPYTPHTDQVDLDYWTKNDTSYMNITVEFPSSGYNVSDWGTPNIVGDSISVNATIWDWTGIDMPLVTTKSHTYSLGNLSVGEYSFIFKAWGSRVKDTTFIVPEFPLLLILPLFIIATLLVIIVYKRKHTIWL
jgi:hypothetical protein